MQRLIAIFVAAGCLSAGCSSNTTATTTMPSEGEPVASLPAVAPTVTTATTPQLPAGVNLIAWLRPEANGAALAGTVSEWTDVEAVAYVSQQDAYDELATLFAHAPDVVEGVSPEQLPASLRLVVTGEGVADRLAGRPEVVSVTTASEAGPAEAACPSPQFTDADVVVFVADTGPINEIRAEMAAWAGIDEVEFFARAETYDEFVAVFGDAGTVIEGIAPEDLPVSLRALSTDLPALEGLREHLLPIPGVIQVNLVTDGFMACRESRR